MQVLEWKAIRMIEKPSVHIQKFVTKAEIILKLIVRDKKRLIVVFVSSV